MKGYSKKRIHLALAIGVIIAAASAGNVATAQTPPSGLMLGVNVHPVFGGLRVQYTLPGYSASGLFLPGDVFTRGSDGLSIFPLATMSDIEHYKGRVGPGRVGIIEFFRPNVGTLYYWVSFTPVGGTNAYHAAEFTSETTKPGAKAAFEASAAKSQK